MTSKPTLLSTLPLHPNYFYEESASQHGMEEASATSGVFEGVAQGPYQAGSGQTEKSSIRPGRDKNELPIAIAYDKFKNKTLPYSNQMFSTISCQEYFADRGGCFAKEINKETPLQRIARLKAEISDVMDFIKTTLNASVPEKETLATVPSSAITQILSPDTTEPIPVDPLALLNELENLKGQLDCLSLSDKSFMCAPMGVSECLFSESERQIVDLVALSCLNEKKKFKEIMSTSGLQLIESHLSALQSKLQDNSSQNISSLKIQNASELSTSDSAKPFVYEVYCTHRCLKETQLTQVIALERRVAELESLLGVNHLSHISMPYPDIASAVTDIANALLLVNPKSLENLVERFKRLNVQMDDFLKSKEHLMKINGETVISSTPGMSPDPINELYTFYDSARPTIAVLPMILKRLEALMTFHQNASCLVQRLDDLENQQREMNSSLQCLEQDLESIKNSISEAIANTKNIVDSLQKASKK